MYVHTCIYTHIYMFAHIHTYTYIPWHTHTKCTYERTQPYLERRCGSDCARSRCKGRKLCKSLLFDAIKPPFAPPMQGLHCTHFLKHQYPSTPHPLFPTYPRIVRRLRASAVLLFYTDQMNRVHRSEESPRSFTMAPCVVVERLVGKQCCIRAAVSEHAGIQAREWSRWLFTKKQEVNEKTTKPCNRPYTITTARCPDNILLNCTGAGPIHPVHSQPMSLATEAMPRNEVTFLPFSRRFPEFWTENNLPFHTMCSDAHQFACGSTLAACTNQGGRPCMHVSSQWVYIGHDRTGPSCVEASAAPDEWQGVGHVRGCWCCKSRCWNPLFSSPSYNCQKISSYVHHHVFISFLHSCLAIRSVNILRLNPTKIHHPTRKPAIRMVLLHQETGQ